MNNLFQLSGRYQQLMDNINQMDELSDEVMQELEAVNDSLDNKVLSYISIIKSMESKAIAIQTAINGMMLRVDSLVNGADKLKDQVKKEMQACEKKKIENEFHKAMLIANNPKVKFSNKELIPDEFMRHKICEITEPNTQLILSKLKENVDVPGAFLIQEQRLQIR